MVNAKDILKQHLFGSLEEKYFKGQHQVYINYANYTLARLVKHWTIYPMEIEESDQKIKQEWLLLGPMVEIFEKLKKEKSS